MKTTLVLFALLFSTLATARSTTVIFIKGETFQECQDNLMQKAREIKGARVIRTPHGKCVRPKVYAATAPVLKYKGSRNGDLIPYYSAKLKVRCQNSDD